MEAHTICYPPALIKTLLANSQAKLYVQQEGGLVGILNIKSDTVCKDNTFSKYSQ